SPWEGSSSGPAGRSWRSASAGARQWANSRSSQVWAITQRPSGSGQGRCSVCSRVAACRAGVSIRSVCPELEIAPERRLALNRLEQGPEVAFAEGGAAVSLDYLEEDRRPILRGLREDLEQVSVLVAVGEDPEPFQVVVRLADLAHPALDLVVVRLGRVQEDHAALLQRLHGLDDVIALHRDRLA